MSNLAHETDEGPEVLSQVKQVDMPRTPLVDNNRSFHWITEKICGILEGPTPRWWWVCFIIALFVASYVLRLSLKCYQQARHVKQRFRLTFHHL